MTGFKTLEPDEFVASYGRRTHGTERNGSVFIREFDQGIVTTLGATLIEDKDGQGNYYVNIPNVAPPIDKPGIPVVFAFPEDVWDKHFLPSFVVRRDDIVSAMERWHPGEYQYRVPATTAHPVEVTLPGQGVVTNWTEREELVQAEPVDILYTVSVMARHRQGINGRLEANEMFRWVLARFNHYGALLVYDSLGDSRTYEVFREGISNLDGLVDVTGRTIGYAVSLRVEAELDIHAPENHKTVTKLPSFSSEGNISVSIKPQ